MEVSRSLPTAPKMKKRVRKVMNEDFILNELLRLDWRRGIAADI